MSEMASGEDQIASSAGDVDDSDIATVMGFASFGKAGAAPASSGLKKNRDRLEKQQKQSASIDKKQNKDDEDLPTDYMKVFEDSLRLARERNQQQQQPSLESQQPSRSTPIGPSLPPTSADNLKQKKDKKEHKKSKKEKKQKKKDKKKTANENSDEELIGPAIPDCFKPAIASTSSDDKETANASESAGEQQEPQPASASSDEPVGSKNQNDEDSSDEEEDDNEDEEAEDSQQQQQLLVPRSSQISLDHRTGKPVVALGLDASGARVVSGGSDFSVRYWNFAGMDSACRPFKVLDQPCGAHQIRFVGFNSTSDCVLVASGSAQLRLYSREGKLIAESVKGYQYISNPRSTPGHTHALLNAAWHPRDGAEFATCGMDNSLRLWDANDTEKILQETRLKSCKEVIVPKSAQGRAVAPSACAYSPDGNQVFAGCIDGSIQAWDRRKRFVNNCHLVRGAHGADTLTCLGFSYDGVCLLSRSMDDTLKLWDIRQLKQPLFVRADLSTQFEQTACGFAPNDRLFYTATSAPAKICEKDGRSPGQLLFFDRAALSSSNSSSAAESSNADVLACNFDSGIIRCLWHAKINQLLLSTASGKVCVLFDPKRSVNGARLCSARPAKRGLDQDLLAYKGGYVRESLLTYDEETMRQVRQGKRKSKFYELESANSLAGSQRKLYQAEAPLSGPGYGGKLGQKGGTLHQYMLQQMVRKRGDDPADKDIRGAILRHNEEAQRNPMWTGAYAKTQPVPVFQEAPSDGGEDDAGASGTDEAKKRRLL